MRPPGTWGPKEFAQFTEDELHETMMGAQPGSNYFEWAKAELEHRDRRSTRANAASSLEHQPKVAKQAETQAEEADVKPDKTQVENRFAAAPTVDLHPAIKAKCSDLYTSGHYAEAVEKGFKVVRDRLRSLTGYEKGADAFGKGGLHIGGAAAPNVEGDFNEAVKFLLMSIDFFRNEKAHTSDAKITDHTRAEHYLMLSSLAMHLLENAHRGKTPTEPNR
jgi:uncharacterized protein (TIGR02391 family)